MSLQKIVPAPQAADQQGEQESTLPQEDHIYDLYDEVERSQSLRSYYVYNTPNRQDDTSV